MTLEVLTWHSPDTDSSNLNPQADLNHDGYSNIMDIVIIALRWHQTW
jgi:hypothetical protein